MINIRNLVKESSERSDADNWIKAWIEGQGYTLQALEGGNQDRSNLTTHVFERAACELDGDGELDLEAARQEIESLETTAGITRLLRCAGTLGLPLHYVLYEYASNRVFVLRFDGAGVAVERSYPSFESFGAWLAEIKGWRSTKVYLEPGLPEFDVALRKAHTPWPVNIDAFLLDRAGDPKALVEFQNAGRTGVVEHCNNVYFWGYRRPGDQRRWQSQEILRVQSGLPYFIIVWRHEVDPGARVLRLKRLDHVALPVANNGYQYNQNTESLRQLGEAKADYNAAQREGRDLTRALATVARASTPVTARPSFTLSNLDGQVREVRHAPPVTREQGTFPMLYYGYNEVYRDPADLLVRIVSDL